MFGWERITCQLGDGYIIIHKVKFISFDELSPDPYPSWLLIFPESPNSFRFISKNSTRPLPQGVREIRFLNCERVNTSESDNT